MDETAKESRGIESKTAIRVVLLTAAISALITVWVVGNPAIRLAFRNPPLHVAIDAVVGFVGLLSAYLALGRFRQNRALSDLVLFCALTILGFTNLVFGAGSLIVSGEFSDVFTTWSAAGGRTLGAGVVALAAFAPARPLEDGKKSVWIAVAGCFVAMFAIGLTVGLSASSLPSGLATRLPVSESAQPVLEGHSAVHTIQLMTALFYGAAAFGFLRVAARRGDELMSWLSCGCVLASFAAINYYLFPTLYSAYVFTGDAFRLGHYMLFLLGASREISAYWSGLSNSLVLEERRRLARELHDGLAQEVSFVVTRVRSILEDRGDDLALRQIATAAENALYESRRAISALTDPVDESLDVALGKLAADITQREGLGLDLKVQPDIKVPAVVQEQMLRIAREAMTNAVRHGNAGKITIELQNLEGLSLLVEDDGRGFLLSDSQGRGGGFGLISMKERAKALSGNLKVRSTPGRGTRVEVLIPEVQ